MRRTPAIPVPTRTAAVVRAAGGIGAAVARFGTIAVLAISLLLAAGGCRRPAPVPNLILVSIDALRADGLGSYGNPRPASPRLDQLAARGTRFARAYVATYGTTPSHTTMLSGTYQERHRVSFGKDDGPTPRTTVPADLPWLPSLLGERGVHTIAVTDAGNISAKFGFARGFAVHDDRGGGADRRVKVALRYLDERPRDRPFFLFLHTYEVHSPYEPPRRLVGMFGERESSIDATNKTLLHLQRNPHLLRPEHFRWLRARYDEEIFVADRALGRLFDALEARGDLANTLIVVTSDHGEEFGEHGSLIHRGTLHDELLHVPLLVVGPGIPPGRVDEQLVSSADLAPSILATLGLPVPDQMQGRRRFGPDPEPPARVLVSQFGEARYSVRSERFKLIDVRFEPRTTYLYDLAADPGETTNVADQHPERVAGMLRAIEAFRRTHAPPGAVEQRAAELDAEDLRQLEALGYVDGG